MATDWTSPKTSDTHTNELAATRGRDESNARMDYTGDTNIPDGTIRWNKTNNRFEIWNATTSTWSVLSSKYLINVDTVDGYHAGNASGNVPVSNGTVNTNLNADLLDGQHGTFFQARENHTGTQAPSTISPQGTGSGLNADLLDGLHSSAFLGVSAKAVDSDKLDGLDSSNFNRVIDLTGQVQTTSYRKSVIALCNLDNTDIQRNSWSTGRISFHYSNGLITDLSVLYTASKKYDTTSMNWAAFISNASDVGPGIQPCTFTYNGVKYGGIHFYYHPASSNRIVWEGNQTVEGSFEPFGLDYYDTLNNIALNTEVNGSLVIDGADIVKSTRAEFNNNLLWHAGNDGAGSGLDADTVDGYHASAFALAGHIHTDSSTIKPALNASGDAPIYACRAWVNFDGTTNPPTIRASGNVSSIIKNGTGDYTINFTTAMPDENYAISLAHTDTIGGTWLPKVLGSGGGSLPYTYSTTAVRVGFGGENTRSGDIALFTVAIFR